MVTSVMTVMWLMIILLALIVLAPFYGSREVPFRDKRGSWHNYR
jgi:hypothetical protein